MPCIPKEMVSDVGYFMSCIPKEIVSEVGYLICLAYLQKLCR